MKSYTNKKILKLYKAKGSSKHYHKLTSALTTTLHAQNKNQKKRVQTVKQPTDIEKHSISLHLLFSLNKLQVASFKLELSMFYTRQKQNKKTKGMHNQDLTRKPHSKKKKTKNQKNTKKKSRIHIKTIEICIYLYCFRLGNSNFDLYIFLFFLILFFLCYCAIST